MVQELQIKQKAASGYIDRTVVNRVDVKLRGKCVKRYGITFWDKEMVFQLRLQRGQGARLFLTLDAAANTLERIGITKFVVQL